MDVEKVFHMTGGVGDTSYARNSSLQKKGSDMVKHITIETIQEVYMKTTPKSIGIADLGCSSGQNTFSTIKTLVDAVGETCQKLSLYPPPEFRIYLNDLPTNDFNAIFKSLPDFYKELKEHRNYGISSPSDCSPAIYIAGYPGTFYGRLFPDNCLHFIYSSYSLHWLSRVPAGIYDKEGKSVNKGSIYISESSPAEVSQAYHRQFQEDFNLFLRSRSGELVSGGSAVLILLGRGGSDHVDRGNSFLWKILSRSFKILISKGQVDAKSLDEYDVHFYAASEDEIREEVSREGSFVVERLEMFEMEKKAEGEMSYGTAVAMAVRAIQESMISHHFGEEILDSLFDIFGKLVDEELGVEEISLLSFVLALKKL
ncbi:hypothetical protein DCAR_0624778 [Daucus carota subsp. sativus]|uniref:Jasmonate O-methyltransferase n=2 Tax=Daucus carota subsp. sativus TaxID=79200 RepID=A0AAF1B657_DAUCS|nr:PREDICTED: salicylate carboxymethyltransferase-like [Daucus carota subsp. sativus]WOH05362.1 hypothetical protein DCAR_0624778 [Daucus carota subsp. sativus]